MSFLVVFTGELREGFSRRRGIEALAQRFNLGFEEIKRLLAGNRQTVKRVSSREQAEKVVHSLWSGGWHSELLEDGRVVFRTDRPEQEPLQTAAEDDSLPASDDSFSVRLPDDWQQCEGLNPQALLQAGDLQRHRYLVVLKQPAGELPRALALSDYCAAQLQQCIEKVREGRLCSEPQPLLEARLPAYAGEMIALVGEVEIQYLVASLQSDDCFYTLFLWCERGEFEGQRESFSEIVAGFRLAGGENREGGPARIAESAESALEEA